MTKRYKILQKKLQDLESDLSHTLSCPSEPLKPDQIEYFHDQLVFLNKLLSAEIASNPSKPHHLSHISNRLNELQEKIDNWELSRARTDGSDPVEIGSNLGSDCSCTESCLNDDGEEADPEAFYVMKPEAEPEPEPEPEEELFFEVGPDRAEGESEKGVWDWANGPVLAGGVVLVAGLVIGLWGEFYGCLYYYVNYQGSLIPT